MKLGILVNTNRHLEHVVGLTNAAVAKGHAVELFTMDDGIELLQDDGFRALAELANVSMRFCEHSAHMQKADVGNLPETIVSGSQLNNAMMNHSVDRMVVL